MTATVVTAGDNDDVEFHLHQENAGQWVIEAPHSTDLRMKSMASKDGGKAFPWGVFRVPAADEADTSLVPVSGRWVVENDRLLFRPKYAFREGLRFQVAELRGDLAGRSLWDFRIPRGGGPEPRLVEIRPVADQWPANLLRIYLHFNRPMARGEATRRIVIRDESGRVLVQPFLELDQELWDRGGRRLTLLFDPGRVKSGLKPREEDGAILEEGRRYTIEVKPGWPDARGLATEDAFLKTILIGPADFEPIMPRKWKIAAPRARSTDPLVITFDQPIDTGIALRLIAILESGECPLDGQTEISPDGLVWKFTPNVNWSPGLHFVEVDPSLEDSSGNQVGRPFERDMKADSRSLMKSAKPTRLTFVVQATE